MQGTASVHEQPDSMASEKRSCSSFQGKESRDDGAEVARTSTVEDQIKAALEK